MWVFVCFHRNTIFSLYFPDFFYSKLVLSQLFTEFSQDIQPLRQCYSGMNITVILGNKRNFKNRFFLSRYFRILFLGFLLFLASNIGILIILTQFIYYNLHYKGLSTTCTYLNCFEWAPKIDVIWVIIFLKNLDIL